MYRPGGMIIIHDRWWTVETLRRALPHLVKNLDNNSTSSVISSSTSGLDLVTVQTMVDTISANTGSGEAESLMLQSQMRLLLVLCGFVLLAVLRISRKRKRNIDRKNETV